MRNDSPSATARLIAAATVFLRSDRTLGSLVPAAAAGLCRDFVSASSPSGGSMVRAMDRGWFRVLAGGLERLTLPGILLHYALRKRFLEDVARAGLEEGIRQVVILGGGFDTLALRLHRDHPGARFIEADHPATQAVKTRVVEERHSPGRNVSFVPVDFSRADWERGLLACPGYDPELRSLFIMEGVLMYLDMGGVDRIFRFIRERGGPGSRFAFTFMEPSRHGSVNFRNCSPVVKLWLRLKGEPFDWGVRRRDLPAFLASRGFGVVDLATPEIFRRRYLDPARAGRRDLAEGEYVCVADQRSH